MTADIGLTVVGLLSVIVNYIALYIIFPCRYGKRLSITLTVLFVDVFYLFLILTGLVTTTFYGLRGFIHLPMILVLFRGQFFQKTFATFFVMVLTGMQIFPAKAIAGLLVPTVSPEYYCFYIGVLSGMYLIYLFAMFKFGSRIFDKMFINGRKIEWVIYSLGALFSLMIMAFLQSISIPVGVNMTLLVFILWSFCILCFAIINTHEKTKQKLDAELARSIVSSGRDHYQKMDEMHDKLRIMRHDYKHHLNAARKMLSSGNVEEANQYLNVAESKLSESELQSFCENTVINALVASFAERCAKLFIKFTADISVLNTVVVPDYEMCIIIGNLLENAIEACEKSERGRVIELAAKTTSEQLLLMVKNSFCGTVFHDDGELVSNKANGGFGLRSIREVVARYDGDLHIEWDEHTFTAYAAVRL